MLSAGWPRVSIVHSFSLDALKRFGIKGWASSLAVASNMDLKDLVEKPLHLLGAANIEWGRPQTLGATPLADFNWVSICKPPRPEMITMLTTPANVQFLRRPIVRHQLSTRSPSLLLFGFMVSNCFGSTLWVNEYATESHGDSRHLTTVFELIDPSRVFIEPWV